MRRVLLFDFDGVIADSIDVCMKRVIGACKKHGYNQISTKLDFLSLYDGNFYENLVKRGIHKEDIPYLIKDFHVKSKEQKNVGLFSGIKDVMEELAEQNKIIVITSNATQTVKAALRFNNIDCFEEVLGADKETSKVKKINYVKSKYKGYELFYIGDTAGDMIEGKKAGVKTVAVTWGFHNEEKLRKENPDFIVHSPAELADVLKNSSNKNDFHKKVLIKNR